MKYLYRVGESLVILGIASLTLAQKPAQNPGIGGKESLPRLASLSSIERMQVLERASTDRSDLQAALITQLRDHSNPKEVTISVAFLLGLHRMEQAVQDLSTHITLTNYPLAEDDRRPLIGEYPVVDALIRIGSPAIPEMIKNIETSDDRKVCELSAKVIRYVDGREIASFRLQKAMERQSDPGKKARLKAAMDCMKPPPR
jgi:hypothetical protein